MAASMSAGHFPAGSKLLQKRWNERQLKTHQMKIASMKADIDNKNPLVHSHLKLKLKKIQLGDESQTVVDNENKVLVNRISRIMREPGRLDNWNEAYKPRSLNQRHRSTIASKIQDENNHLVRRLNRIKPLYNVKQWENDFNFHEYVLHNMRTTTKDFGKMPMSRSPARTHSPIPHNEERIKFPSVELRNGHKVGNVSPTRLTKIFKLPPKTETPETRKAPSTATQEPFDPGRDAKLLHTCEGDADCVDCSILSRCLAQRKFRERMQTREEFERLFEEDHLLDFLRERFNPSFNHLLVAFLAKREAYDATTLRDALDDAPRRGGREATLIEVICTRHDLALKAIEKEYSNKYGSQLSSDIVAMTSGDLQDFLLMLLSRERSSNLDVDQDLASEDAEELLKTDAEERWKVGEKSGRFYKMLKSENYAQMRAAFVEYESISGLEVAASVNGAMENENDANTEYWHAVVAFVKCLRNCPAFFTENIHNSIRIVEKQNSENLKEANTSWAEKTLIRCILTRCEADFSQILRTYRKRYGISLYANVDERCNLLYKELILAVIKYQGQSSRKRNQQSNGKRVAGMIIRGPPVRHTVSRPPPTCSSPERLQQSPLNKPVNKTAANPKRYDEVGKGNLRRRRSQVSNAATVTPARDFNAERDVEQVSNSMKVWESEGHRTVLSILTSRSNEQRQKLRSVYAAKYKRDLVSDLRKAVKDSFYGELLAGWTKTKVEFDAIALHEALRNAKKEAVAMEIFCTRPNKHVKGVADAYRRLYGSTITETIKEKQKSGYWKEILVALSRTERDVTSTVSSGTATSSATNLYEDEISGLGGSKFMQIFTKCNISQIRATLSAFKKVSGKDLQEFIRSSPEDDNEKKDAMNTIVSCCKDPATYFCNRVHKHITQDWNMPAACRIFLSRAEVDLEIIKQIYLESYGRSIKADLDSACEEKYKQFLLHLLSPPTPRTS